MTWQPIETAPKDGTEFLAYDPDLGMVIASWVMNGWYFNCFDGDGMGFYDQEPTHWQALPAKP